MASKFDLTDRQPKFVQPLSGKYLCTHEPHGLRLPVKQSACGHRFCSECLDAILKSIGSKMCPANEDGCVELSPQTVYPDRGTDRELSSMFVFCINKNCAVTLRLRELEGHLVECEHHIQPCPNESLGCPEQLNHRNIKTHLSENCMYVKTTCIYCTQCYLKQDIAEHQTQCMNEESTCIYARDGCQYKGKRVHISEHLQDPQTIAHHLQLTKQSLDTLRDQNLNLEKHFGEASTISQHLLEKLEQHKNEIASLKNDTKISFEQIKTAAKSSSVHSVRSASVSIDNTESPDVAALSQRLSLLEGKTYQGQNGASMNIGSEERRTIEQNSTTLAAHESTIRDMEIRFRCIETGSHDGRLVWKITNYANRKQAAISGQTLSIYSQPFYSDQFGYKMCARAYLNGDGMGKGTHLSLYFVVMKGDYDDLLPWPFRQRITMILLDQANRQKHIHDTFRPDPTSGSFRQPKDFMNVASGNPLFVAQSIAERSPYCVSDTLFLMIKVDIADLSHIPIRL